MAPSLTRCRTRGHGLGELGLPGDIHHRLSWNTWHHLWLSGSCVQYLGGLGVPGRPQYQHVLSCLGDRQCDRLGGGHNGLCLQIIGQNTYYTNISTDQDYQHYCSRSCCHCSRYHHHHHRRHHHHHHHHRHHHHHHHHHRRRRRRRRHHHHHHYDYNQHYILRCHHIVIHSDNCNVLATIVY